MALKAKLSKYLPAKAPAPEGDFDCRWGFGVPQDGLSGPTPPLFEPAGTVPPFLQSRLPAVFPPAPQAPICLDVYQGGTPIAGVYITYFELGTAAAPSPPVTGTDDVPLAGVYV